MKVNLSGHIHAQSIAEKKMADGNIVTDIVASSLSVYTNKYGVQISSKKKIVYPIDMEVWEKRNGIIDEKISEF